MNKKTTTKKKKKKKKKKKTAKWALLHVHTPLERVPVNWHLLYLPESEQNNVDQGQNAE